MKSMDKKPDYMTVPAAMRELEKIEMLRLTENIYRMDHAVTKIENTILEAVGIDVPLVKYRASEISRILSR